MHRIFHLLNPEKSIFRLFVKLAGLGERGLELGSVAPRLRWSDKVCIGPEAQRRDGNAQMDMGWVVLLRGQ
jgi:hypothetical protein